MNRIIFIVGLLATVLAIAAVFSGPPPLERHVNEQQLRDAFKDQASFDALFGNNAIVVVHEDWKK